MASLTLLAVLLGAITARSNPVLSAPSTPSLSQACTTTIFRRHSFVFGPTFTSYTATGTTTVEVDCGRCTSVEVEEVPEGVGPVVFFTTTVTASKPSLATEFSCSESETPTRLPGRTRTSTSSVESAPPCSALPALATDPSGASAPTQACWTP